MSHRAIESHVIRAVAVLALAVPSATALSGAECVPQWDNAIGQPGMDALVWELVEYKGDLIAGGTFTNAGGDRAQHIARWDGSAWHSLGGGMNESVIALTVFNDDLIAGGNFTIAGGTGADHMARWDGKSWHPLGDGLSGGVVSLVVHEDQLFAGGNFSGGVRRWNGSTWQSIGSLGSTAHTLATFDGHLIAGGGFITASGNPAFFIAQWNGGSSWQPLGDGMNSQVDSLTVYNGDLIAAGNFTMAGDVKASNIARWDGSSWNALGSGLDNPQTGMVDYVPALAVYDGQLIVGGKFSQAGELPVNYLARWDGSTWNDLGNGVQGSPPVGAATVEALALYGDALVVGGFFATAGFLPSTQVAAWNSCAVEPVFPSDINGDGFVNGVDLGILLSAWSLPAGSPGCGGTMPCSADLNGDGVVDGNDLGILFLHWTR